MSNVVDNLEDITKIAGIAAGAKETTVHNITVGSDYTLTTAQNLFGRVVVTDTDTLLVAEIGVILDTSERELVVKNSTAQVLTFKTSVGTGVAVKAGATVWLYCDGTNVIESVDNVVPDTKLSTSKEEIINSNADEWVKNQCTAWATFNDVTDTTGDSFNIGSIIDTNVGRLAVTFAVAMDTANYSVDVTSNTYGTDTLDLASQKVVAYGKTTTGFNIATINGGVNIGSFTVDFQVFGGKI